MTSPAHMIRQGQGEPTLLLHGIGSRAEAWAPVFGLVSRTRDIIAVDLPGFGRTPLGSVTPTVSGYADYVEGLIAELGIDQPHIGGSSMGGGIALELGRRGVARSVVAFSPIGFWRPLGLIWAEAVVGYMCAIMPKVRPALPLLLRSSAGRGAGFGLVHAAAHKIPADVLIDDADAFASAEALPGALAAFSEHVFTERGALDDIPVTVVWGSRDVILPSHFQARRARQALPDAAHVLLPRCGHIPFADDPVGCAMLLLQEWRDKR